MKKLLSIIIVLMSVGIDGNVRAESYDLDSFLSLVDKHSKDLKLAGKDRETARAEKREAISTALPHVNGQAGYLKYLSDSYMYINMGEDGTQKFRANRENAFSASVVATQTLFSLQVGSAIKAAKQYEKLTDYIYDASSQQIVTMAKTAFYGTLLLEKVWKVAKESEANAYENYKDVKNSFDNGLASEFALLQAEVRYKDLVPQTTAAQRDYEVALVDLKNLAGLSVDEDIQLTANLEEYPDLPITMSVEEVLTARPDYNALLWEEKLCRTGVTAERAAYYPSLHGSLAYNFSSQSDDFKIEQDNNTWTAGLSLNIPIFQGGATRAKVRKARIELDKTRIRLEKSREDIERDLRSIRLRLEESYGRIQSAEATLNTARKAFSIAEATSKSGLATQLELKDTRVMLDQATTGYYAAVFEYLTSYFAWEYASGTTTMPAKMQTD